MNKWREHSIINILFLSSLKKYKKQGELKRKMIWRFLLNIIFVVFVIYNSMEIKISVQLHLVETQLPAVYC